MLEIGASGSVGGKGGNILVYPANDRSFAAAHWPKQSVELGQQTICVTKSRGTEASATLPRAPSCIPYLRS
jgi:hypothetical protein